MQQEDFPIDPTPDLGPTAKRILDAGVRVLDREGFGGLTFERIAAESGENGALIRYHFGSKAGLVSALVDDVLYAQASRHNRVATALATGQETERGTVAQTARGGRQSAPLPDSVRITPSHYETR